MAGALVGGSFLSAFLQVLFDRMASREILDFFKGQPLNDRMLKKLCATMISVNGLLDDAEEKQITKPAVNLWLNELKHALYEAEDLLDDIAYEARQTELEAGSHNQNIKDQVFSFFSSRNPFNKRKEAMVAKLEQIFETLEHLLKQKDALGLKEGVGGRHSSQKIPTTSLVDESDVYGRDGDKKDILDLLLSDVANVKNPGVIPIVGMGGVGKTTLAQIVYNDSEVQAWFDVKMWTCVSEDFDVFKVTKDILKEVGSECSDTMTPNELQLELQRKLSGRKFFLVLDDVWNDKFAVWDILMRPLKSGALGSKILITTRHESVASVMRTVPVHHLEVLDSEDCWCLFAKHAFDGESPSLHPKLEVIGRGITKKCEGLPLAAKTLGGLLRFERDAKEWEKILKSNIWDLSDGDILPALRLSYHYLPSHLKRCFAFCAIFPKDFDLPKEALIILWMAEGLLFQPNRSEEMEEVGKEYFRDLLSRSFFQKSSYGSSYFMMHDLINDLAKFVSGEFCFSLEGDHSGKAVNRTRHLSYTTTEYDDSKKFEGIHEVQLLRTFYPLPLLQGYYRRMDNKVVHDLLPSLRHLRVLCLSQYCNLVQLPDSIGNLKHLRCLDLSKTSIQKLPEVVSALYYLQTLELSGCEDLIELPSKMAKLIDLRYLNIVGTKLHKMPSQMGKLTRLRKLTDFFIGKQTGSSIKELGELKHLQGDLCIWNLQNVFDARDAMEANLKGKMHLTELWLMWDGDANDSQHERDVIEQLCPHTNVEYLRISGYGGTRFPDWLGNSSFSNMVSIMLRECKYCTSVPPLGQLFSLKFLWIIECEGVMIIGPEFYGADVMKKPFRSLESLTFEKLPQLNEWIPYADEGEDGAFPFLRELYIKKCPNLTKALPSHLPSLTRLEIDGCQQLLASLPRAPTILRMTLRDEFRDVILWKLYSGLHSLVADKFQLEYSIPHGLEQLGVSHTLEEIIISNYDSLKCFPLELFPKLKILRLISCPNLESLSAREDPLGNFALSSLEIFDCPNLVSFPKGGLIAPKLREFCLGECSNLKSFPERMHSTLPSLENLEISNCPELESFPEGCLPTSLISLEIDGSDRLIASRMLWDLQRLSSLSRFSIGSCIEVLSFPEMTLLPSTLSALEIRDLPSLKTLDHEGLRHLTSLRQLKISNCRELQSLPEEGLPSSLSSLCIFYCPLLEKRCQRETGDDWPKISHIADVEINLCKIS